LTAIKFLKNETNTSCIKNGVENSYFGFTINNHEIIPIFYPPYLLKTIRNNLITKDLVFFKNDKCFKASWDHIKALYEFDIKNEACGLRTLPKLSAAHVIPEKIKNMCVSVASQTLSQHVAATLQLMANCGKFNIN